MLAKPGVWQFSPAAGTWSDLFLNEATPSGSAAIYDQANRRLVIVDTTDTPGYLTARALNLDGKPTWSTFTENSSGATLQLTSVAPQQFSAIYDPANQQMVIYGGYFATSLNTVTGNVWTVSLAPGSVQTWQQLTGSAGPARAFHSAVYDPAGMRMLVFGGYNWSLENNPLAFNDTWQLSLTPGTTPQWTRLDDGTGVAPPPRRSAAARRTGSPAPRRSGMPGPSARAAGLSSRQTTARAQGWKSERSLIRSVNSSS